MPGYAGVHRLSKLSCLHPQIRRLLQNSPQQIKELPFEQGGRVLLVYQFVHDMVRVNEKGVKELADLLGENEAAVAAEIAEMENEHIICGYHTLINWDNTDEEKVIALIEVKVTPQREMGFDKIAERIYQYSEVTSVYLMSGGYDFTVMIEAKTMRAVAQFVAEKLSTIDSVLSTATHFILKKYKDHGTVLCDGPQDERMLIVP